MTCKSIWSCHHLTAAKSEALVWAALLYCNHPHQNLRQEEIRKNYQIYGQSIIYRSNMKLDKTVLVSCTILFRSSETILLLYAHTAIISIKKIREKDNLKNLISRTEPFSQQSHLIKCMVPWYDRVNVFFNFVLKIDIKGKTIFFKCLVLFSNCCKSTYIYHKKLFTRKVNVAPEKKNLGSMNTTAPKSIEINWNICKASMMKNEIRFWCS